MFHVICERSVNVVHQNDRIQTVFRPSSTTESGNEYSSEYPQNMDIPCKHMGMLITQTDLKNTKHMRIP